MQNDFRSQALSVVAPGFVRQLGKEARAIAPEFGSTGHVALVFAGEY
jgi:hypothetical protein